MMGFSSWYVVLIIGFASGVAVGRLWDEGWCYIKLAYRQLHDRNNHPRPHSEGC